MCNTWLGVDSKEIDIVLSAKSECERPIVVISYDLVSATQKKLLARNFNFIIADESHFLKSMKAQRTISVLPLLKAYFLFTF